MDELVLFPQGEHDDLFDGLQTMVEGAMSCAAVQAHRYSPIPRIGACDGVQSMMLAQHLGKATAA